MGNEQVKETKHHRKPIDKTKLDILVKQIYFTAQLQKDRKRGIQMTKEKELLAMIREPANKRSRENEYQKASSIVNDVKMVKAHEYIMRYADILKDNSLVIQQSGGDPNKIVDLLPYAESIIWGCNRANLDVGQQFVAFIGDTFGLQVQGAMLAGTKVTQDIKDCFDSLIATERQVKLYLIDFCRQKGLDLAVLNEVGHNISPEALSDDPKANPGPSGGFDQGGFNQNQGGFSQGQGGFPSGQQGGFNPNQGGWNNQGQNFGNQPNYGNQGGFNQGPGGFPQQGGYNPNQGPNYSQQGGNYPNQGGFSQQGGFNPNQGQGGFPQQGGYNPNQGGFSQQGGFNPNQGPNYSQQGQQSNFNNQGFVPTIQQQQPQNTNLQSFNNSQNPNQFYVPPQNQPQDFSKQASNVQPQNTQPSNDFGGGAYPNFTKFTDNNAGGFNKPGNDPLDELDLRLKNIKNGL